MEHFSPTPSPIGGRSFIDPARVRILLAPVGEVKEEDFAQWCEYVRTFETIRLTDLPSSSSVRTAAAAASPHILQSGEIHLSFVTSYDPDHAFLGPFNLHRQVLGVLGLTSYSPTKLDTREQLEDVPAALRELHPGALLHRVFAFDTGAKRPETVDLSSIKASIDSAGNKPAGASSPHHRTPSETAFSAHKDGGLIIFPAVRRDGKDVKFYLKTLLTEFVAGVLDGLDHIVSGLEGVPLETPRETLEGIATGRSSFGGVGYSRPFSRPANALGGGSQPGDLNAASNTSSSSMESTRSKIMAANANKKPKRVTSMTGTGPTGTGRLAKVKADFHLLCGNLWEALDKYAACLNALGKERALAGGQDAVWFASALEGFAVTRVLVSRMGGVVLEKAPSFDLPWSAKDKDHRDKDGVARPYAKESWAEVAEAYTVALVIYSKCLAPPNVLLEAAKSVTNETPRDFTHPLIHAGASVQYARFLLAVWASAGWNGECFDQLVYGGVPPSLAEDRPTPTDYARFTSLSGVARHDIGAAASSALTHSVAALKASDHITLLSTLTGIFGCIGFSRREAYVLRRLQEVIVKLLEKAIKFTLRPPETVSLPLQCSPPTDELLGNMVVQTTIDAVGRGPEAVLVLAMQICETYGIHVEVEPLSNIPSTHILSKASEGLRSAYASPIPPSQEWTQSRLRHRSHPQQPATAPPPLSTIAIVTPLEMHNEAPFGWKEQQILLLKDAMSIAEMLGDHVGMAFFAVVLLRDFFELLSADEQQDLMYGIRRTVQAARWQGAHTLAVKYWGPPEPLSDLQIVPLSPQRQVVSRPIAELRPAADSNNVDKGIAGLDNPFFWNPSRTAALASGSKVAVQGESIEVLATVQNPFSVELEIDALKLVTEGVAFDPHTQHVMLPPFSIQTLRLSGTASETGQLSVQGVSFLLAGCVEESFLLAISDKDSEKTRQTAAAEADDRRTRIKVVGLDARSSVLKQRQNAKSDPATAASARKPSTSTEAKSARAVTNYLQVQVVPAQPLLTVYCPELGRERRLNLYEGETQLIHLQLRNTSETLAINYLKVRFSDDLSESTVQAASSGEMLPGDVHDLYAGLLQNPTLQQQPSSADICIEAGACLTLPVYVRGKKGCTTASVILEFGHVDEKTRLLGNNFYTRSVLLPFAVDVQPVLVCSGFDVLPLSAVAAAKLTAHNLVSHMHMAMDDVVLNDGGERGDGDTEAALIAATTNTEAAPTDDASFCLLSVDVTNVHPLSDAVVRFSLNTGGVHPLRVHRTIRPAATVRCHLPLPRLTLSAEQTAREISTLGQEQRQFIVSKIQLSAEETVGMRKRFWHRHELLQRLRATWVLAHPDADDDENGGDGAADEETCFGDVSMQFVTLDDRRMGVLARDPVRVELDVSAGSSSSSRVVGVEDFAEARISVTNQSGRPLGLHVRLVPVLPTLPAHATAGVASTPPPPTPLIDDAASSLANNQVLIADGTSTASPTPSYLQNGETITLTTHVLFLAVGVFAFVVNIDEIAPAAETDDLPRAQRITFTSHVTNVHVHPQHAHS